MTTTRDSQGPEQVPERQEETFAGCLRTWKSEELLGGRQEVLIQHGQETYRLRLTRHGKLILHK